MGYLNNSTITVDAILTKKGRELLARGRDEFKIKQFALADDEIDYDLYNPEHPLGTAYYGAAIENMPVVEALADETQMLKYKLVTLPKGTARIPVVRVAQTNIELNANESTVITPSTVNFGGGNRSFGYTAILSDTDVAYLNVAPGGEIDARFNPTVADFAGDSTKSVSVVGRRFQVVAKPQPIETKTATITIIGNETGGVQTISLTVNKENLSSNILERAVY